MLHPEAWAASSFALVGRDWRWSTWLLLMVPGSIHLGIDAWHACVENIYYKINRILNTSFKAAPFTILLNYVYNQELQTPKTHNPWPRFSCVNGGIYYVSYVTTSNLKTFLIYQLYKCQIICVKSEAVGSFGHTDRWVCLWGLNMIELNGLQP